MWRVVDGQVVDEDGVEVEGVEPWGDSQAVCGIRVVTTLEQVGQLDFDDWSRLVVRMERNFQVHSGKWAVNTQLHDGRPLTLYLETIDDVRFQSNSSQW